MSWTDCFPVLNEEMLTEAEAGYTLADRERSENWFGVREVIGRRQDSHHVLSVSLFFKNTYHHEGEIPEITEDLLKFPDKYGVDPRFNPWEHYVEPLLRGGPILAAARPDIALRVYLAADLHFLAERLAAFAEVYLMRGSSIRSSPGMLWRFLALENEDAQLTTVQDADLLGTAGPRLALTEQLLALNLSAWRVPVPRDFHRTKTPEPGILYRAMAGCYSGYAIRLPIRRLLDALLWHLKKGSFPIEGKDPRSDQSFPLFGHAWPDYGFDEFFLNVAVFPRVAAAGVLTLLGRKRSQSIFLPYDIEYATWANPRSSLNSKVAQVITAGHRSPQRRHRVGNPENSGSLANNPRLLHLGCGRIRLSGWQNLDLPEIDIRRALPWESESADAIFLEHVIEHVTPPEAFRFMKEAHRVLKPGGVLRLAFPDVVRIARGATESYREWLKQAGWGDGSASSAVESIILNHRHLGVWSEETMRVALKAAGFEVRIESVGESSVPHLRNLEQHGTQIGHENNAIETCCLEAVKCKASQDS